MFRITGPPEEGRCEPTLFSAPRLASSDPSSVEPPEGRGSADDRDKMVGDFSRNLGVAF